MKRLSVNGLRRQAGVTILEFIAFIGLAALVIAGALGLYQTANTGASNSDFVQGVAGIITSLRQVGAGADGANVRAASITVPTGWSLAGQTFTHRKSTATVTLATPTNANFTLNLAGQSTEAQAVRRGIAGKKFGNVTCSDTSCPAILW